MADPITREQLENASLDALTLSAIVTGDADPGLVADRLGGSHRTLAKIEADALPLAADFAAHEARLDEAEADIDTIEAGIAAGGVQPTFYANPAAAQADGALANGSYYRVYPSTHGGAYDLYTKTSGVASVYRDTVMSKTQSDTLLADQLATLTRLYWARQYGKPSKNRPGRALCTQDGRLLISCRPQDAVYRDGYARHQGDLAHFEVINMAAHGFTGLTIPHLWVPCSIWSEFASTYIDQANFSWNSVPGSSSFDTGEGHSTNDPVFFVDKMSNSAGGNVNGDSVVTGSITANVLTVTAVTSGALKVGNRLAGANIVGSRFITALGTGSGGVGTYNVTAGADAAAAVINAYGWNNSGSGPGHGLIDLVSFGLFIYGDGGSYPAVINDVPVADGTNIRDTLRPGDVMFFKKLVFDIGWQYKTPDGTLAITATNGFQFDPSGVGQFQYSTNNLFAANMGVNAGYAILVSLRDPNRVSVRLPDASVSTIVTGADPAGVAVDDLGHGRNFTFWNTDTLGHCVDVLIPGSYAPFRRNGVAAAYNDNAIISRRAAGPKLSIPSHTNSLTVDNEGGNILSTYHIINCSRANSAPALV